MAREAARLTAVAATGVLAAPADPVLDRIARVAARILGAPSALVSLVDADRQVFGGCVGLPEPWAKARETPLTHSFCQIVVATGAPVVVSDARDDARVCDNLAIAEIGVMAYAGVPLATPDGHVLGSLCVIDGAPRAWTAADVATLEDFAQGAAAELSLRIATRQLAAREATLVEWLDRTEELACCTDADGRLTLVNAAWCRTLGYSRAEASRLSPLQIVAPADQGRYRAVVRRLMRGEVVREFEATLLASDGRHVVCRGWAVPDMASGPDGAPVCAGMRVGFRDVTVERRAEAARARLAAAFDASPDLAALVAPGGDLVYLNRAGRHLLGLAEDADLAAVSMARLQPEAACAAMLADTLSALRRDGTWSGESVLVGAGGEHIPVAVTLVLHVAPEGAGQTQVTSLIARDLRERVRADAALRASEARARAAEARFRASLQASPDPMYMFEVVRDANGGVADFTFTEVNASGGVLYGLPSEDLVGHTLGELFPVSREAGAVFQTFRGVAVTGVAYEGEYRTRDPRARAGWLWLQVVPIDVGDGPVTGLAVTARDITSRKRAEGETRLLQEVTAALAAAGEADAALAGALGAMCRAASLPYGEVWVPEPSGAHALGALVRGATWYDAGDAQLAAFAEASAAYVFAPGIGLPGAAAAERAPVWLADLTAAGANFPRARLARAAGLRNGISVPVMADGEVVAVLAFHARRADGFDESSRALLAAVGAQVGAAVRRRHAEDALRTSEAELRLTQEAGGMRGWTLDLATDELRLAPGGRDVVAVDRARGAAGVAATGEVIPGAALRALIHPDDRATAVADMAAAVADPEGHYVSTYRAPGPDGATRWVRATGRVGRGPDGRALCIRGVSVDVTEERALRQRAERSEAELRALFGAMRDVVLVLDGRGTYVEIVPTAPDLLYQPRTSMLGRRMHDVLPGAVADRLLPVIQRVLATGAPDSVEYELDLPSAGRVWYAATVSPLDAEQVLWVARDMTAQKRAERALVELSTQDELTGLLNRRGFRPVAEQSRILGRRTGRRDGVLYVDLDRFKAINDTYGHAAGDEALRAVARILRETVREGDVVARLGGDEFVVYASGLAQAGEGQVLAARLTAACAAFNARAAAGGARWAVGFSIGVAETEPGDDLDALLARADAALYAAKAAGR